MRQLLPEFAYPVVKASEWLLSLANNLPGMFMMVIIEKNSDGKPTAR